MNELQSNLLRRAVLGDLLSRSADRFRNRVALQAGGQNISFAELNRRASQAANAFLARGIRHGDRVAFMTHNCQDYIYLRLGLSKIGAIPVPINFMLRGKEIEFIVNDSGARMFFVEDKLIPAVQEIREALTGVELFGCLSFDLNTPEADGWVLSSSFFSHDVSDKEPEQLIQSDDVATIMYTTGTESFPKGVMTTHLNYYMSILHMSADCDIGRDDVLILDIPLFHIAGTTLLLSSLTFGAKTIIEYEPDPVNILKKTQDEKVSVWIYPPTLYNALPSVPSFDEYDLSSLKKCITFGAAMPPAVFEKWNTIKPDIAWRNYWGQTESSPAGSTSTPQDFPGKAASIGLPDTGMTIRIVDEEGNEVPEGTPGEIVMRGPAVMKGYWNRPDLTEKTLSGGWLHTGDIGHRDSEGYLFFGDRKKDMIKSGGENVSSQEVEAVLLKHPDVALAAVIGLPHEHWIEAVTGVVVLAQGATLSETDLVDHCKKYLAGFKVPKAIHIRESLPMTPNGKILKRLIRDEMIA